MCVYMFARARLNTDLKRKYQRIEEMRLMCVCNDSICENDRWLFGKHSKITTNESKHAHTLQWWWCENTNINTSSAEYNELLHLVKFVCVRPLSHHKQISGPQFNRQAVWFSVQIFFFFISPLMLLLNSRVIFSWLARAREHCVYFAQIDWRTDQFKTITKWNEMKQAKKKLRNRSNIYENIYTDWMKINRKSNKITCNSH